MGHKYQIPHLLATATRNLKYSFPSKLNMWDKRRSFILMEHAIEAVNLFRLLDCPDMLVSALYDCCRLPAHMIMRGIPRADGTPECLAPEDIELCWDLRYALLTRNANIMLHFTAPFCALPASSCQHADNCAFQIETHLQEWRDQGEAVDDDPLRVFFFVEELMHDYGVCELCAKELDKRAESLRQEVWDDLPEMMGLKVEGWGRAV